MTASISVVARPTTGVSLPSAANWGEGCCPDSSEGWSLVEPLLPLPAATSAVSPEHPNHLESAPLWQGQTPSFPAPVRRRLAFTNQDQAEVLGAM